MNSKKMDIGSKDLISNLPEALIGHILSFLPTKDAALTSVLSKRWRHMLAFVPNLDFDDEDYEDYNRYDMSPLKRLKMLTSFQVFVDRVLALQGNAPVNKFSLSCELGVEPSTDFSTDVGEVFLPKLKTLYLDDLAFNDEGGAAFAKLTSGCHVLEELVMIDIVFYCDFFLVSNPTLKRLKVRLDFTDQKPNTVSFDTPNLVYLEFTDTVGAKYPKANFDSLVEANLDLRMRHYQDEDEPAGDSEDSTNLIMGIYNVKILYLSGATLEVLALCCKAIPIFSNLIRLTIDTHEEVQWEFLPKLLENCPNLETLVFGGLNYIGTIHCKPWEDTRTCLSSSPVKMLKVSEFGRIHNFEERDDMDKQKEMIKFLLETMPNLEQVMIYYDTSIDDDDLSILSTELQKLEEVALSKCKIQVFPDNIY